MKRLAVLLSLGLSVVSSMAYGQVNSTTFCKAGLRPDGYIDFTDLPPAPNFPGGLNGPASPSAPVTYTLQVHGIPGLSVQMTIPSLSPVGGGPVYSVNNGILTLNSNINGSGQLQLQFSQPIAGLSGIGTIAGRAADFTVSSSPTTQTNLAPANYTNGASTDTLAPHYFSNPSQEVALQGTFTLATVSVTGGDFGDPSFGNLRVQSTAAAAVSEQAVPTAGLEMWLKSESATSQFAGGAASWPDQSGQGNDATQTNPANQPGQVEQDGNTCRGAFSFGQNQYFNFNLPIDGWQEMTVFLVGKSLVDPSAVDSAASSSGILWNASALWGSTYVTPYQQSVAFSFGTTQAGNQLLYTRPVNIGQDFTITRAVHDGSTDSLYVDGQLVLQRGNKLPVLNGTTGSGFIGRGLNNTYFTGEMSEILVYDRVLTASEASAVEFYLRDKFGTR
ncbi:MAG TPA: LamG-like jellyroll fold domain-containing protein [Acidobacteriaceae bacterium]|nr:LamG-like jellyroll fold domain-containing protein [Acidobacteriaceae bacterium]